MVSSAVLRYGLAILVFAHGVGHVVGFWGESRGSWVLSRLLPEGVTWAVEVVWMLASAALFVGAVLALLGVGLPHDAWRTLIAVAAVVSLVGILVFWGTWPGGTMFFALVFDLLLLVAVVWYGWPAEAQIGF